MREAEALDERNGNYMTTQRRTAANMIASVLAGALIVAVLGAGLGLLQSESVQELLFGQKTAGQTTATHEVVDSAGRTVYVPESPKKIAAFDAFSGNVCALVGAGDQLMGAPGGVKSNELLREVSPQIEFVEQLSGNSINVETLLSAGVDVALVRGSMYDDGETDRLDELGIPYVVVEYGTIEEQIAAIELVGDVCGGEASARARGVADYYRSTVSVVEERTAQIPEDQRKRVFHSINDLLLTDGSGSVGADWITRAGAVCVSEGESSTGVQGDYTATLEQVYAWDPDVVVCSTASARRDILSDPQWAGLSAVSSGEVYNIPVSTSRWGQRGDPETFLGMLWLGKTLYPDLYADIDLKDTVGAYYRDVIGLEVDDALWEQILSGEGLRLEGSGGQGEK